MKLTNDKQFDNVVMTMHHDEMSFNWIKFETNRHGNVYGITNTDTTGTVKYYIGRTMDGRVDNIGYWLKQLAYMILLKESFNKRKHMNIRFTQNGNLITNITLKVK